VKRSRRPSQTRVIEFDQCEERTLQTLVFVLNGNGYGAASPDALTANAALVIRAAGDQAIQLARKFHTPVGQPVK
jgi:hypothetical protein